MRIFLYVFLFLCSFTSPSLGDERTSDLVTLINNGEYSKALQLARKQADDGDKEAQFILSTMYRNAHGVEQNLHEEVKWLQKSAAQNYRPALYNLALNYLKGNGVQQDTHKGLQLLEKNHSLKSLRATQTLGRIYAYGEYGIAQNYEKAKPYLFTAAERGERESHYIIAYMYFLGKGLKTDEALGIKHLIAAGELGLKKAQIDIAKFEKKVGMPLQTYLIEAYGETAYDIYDRGDYETALQHLQLEAEKGDASANFLLGIMYRDGKGTQKDLGKAFDWQMKGAQQNYRPSIYSVARAYLMGQGVKQNTKEAIRYFEKAHALDYARATNALAIIYLTGRYGIQQDSDKGLSYALAGARSNLADSLYVIGRMIYEGEVAEKDRQTGLLMILEAAQGRAKAAMNFVKNFESENGLSAQEYLLDQYNLDIPLSQLRACPKSESPIAICTTFWDDNVFETYLKQKLK